VRRPVAGRAGALCPFLLTRACAVIPLRVRQTPTAISGTAKVQQRKVIGLSSETEFHEEMESLYRRTGQATGYWPSYFLRSVREEGGLKVAKKLLKRGRKSAGFDKLVKARRSDLSVEFIARDKRFRQRLPRKSLTWPVNGYHSLMSRPFRLYPRPMGQERSARWTTGLTILREPSNGYRSTASSETSRHAPRVFATMASNARPVVLTSRSDTVRRREGSSTSTTRVRSAG